MRQTIKSSFMVIKAMLKQMSCSTFLLIFQRLGMLTSKQRPMRVIGWYHSHPHITVWPSHVGKFLM